jgi:gliding motility-associated-like protein
MRLNISLLLVFLFCILTSVLFAGSSPCSATNYQLSDFGITKTYTLDNGTFDNLPDPSCGDYQGEDFWVTFTGPASGLINIELLDGSITDAAFEVYWNACNGLATSIGCFADRNCGQVDMPGANLQVIPGETYHVRIYQEGGGGGTLGYRMSDLGGTDFSLAGSAQEFNSGNPLDKCIQLTTETPNQVGCAWFDTPVDFTSGFEINYQLYFGDIDGGGADGIAFVFHTDPSPPCSSTGGQLGFVGIPNSFIVEFDTWRNANFGDTTPDDHVAINLNGIINLPIAAPVSIGVDGNVEDGLWHDVTLRWDPVSNFFEVIFDGDQKIFVDISLITNIFVAGQPVYWGLTGSTGAAFNDQIFCFQGFEVENSNSVENNINAKICDGAPYVFNGEVLFDAGEYIEQFPAANGCDSTVTLTLEIVEIDIMGMEEVVIPCDEEQDPLVQLSAEVSSNVEDTALSYSWSTDDGVIDSGQNTLMPMVSSIGTYTLTVISNPDNCEEEFTVVVSNAEAPEVTAEGGFLGCGGNGIGDTLTLFCSGDNLLIVEWTTLDGNIIGDPNVPNPMVDTVGTYTVTVTDSITGCTATSSTTVEGGGSADPGPDLFFCTNETGEIYLQGTASDDVIAVEWIPGAGLIDPNDINSQVIDLNGPSSFDLYVCNLDGPNLIENGNFADGNTGFTSDYTEGTATPGEYLVTDNPQNFNPIFDACPDHSDEDNMMMIIDGDTSPNQNIWCQTLSVEEGLNLSFSAWFSFVCSGCSNSNPPVISFTADGVSVNTPEPLNSSSCSWQEFRSDPFLTTGNTVEICISNLETSLTGNDFAMDDIEMFSICKGFAGTCNVFPYQEFDIDFAPVELQCQVDQITELSASLNGSPSNDYTWSWTGGGNILAGGDTPNPTVQGAGTYTVNALDNVTGCDITREFELIEIPPVLPDFDLVAEELTCDNAVSTVQVIGLDPSNDYDFLWSGLGLSNMGVDRIEVMEPGVYTVLVTNVNTQCSAEMSIEVFEDKIIPEADIQTLPTLKCKDQNEIITLDGIPSSIDPNITYEWTSSDGNVIDGSGITAQVQGEGTYILTVFNIINGCSDQAFINVSFDLTPPIASIIPPEVITCNNPNIDIIIDSPPGSDYAYDWSNDPMGGSSITVDAPGAYEVVVTDNETGCTVPLMTNVVMDDMAPQYTIGTPATLTCNTPQVDININGSGNLEYAWISSNDIISSLNTNTATVVSSGQYEVLVTNLDNGCTQSEIITVSSDFSEPQVEAGDPLTFGCSDTSLDLSGSSIDNITSIQWQTSGGILLSGDDSFNPSIGGAGTYTIIVTGENGCTSSDFVLVEADNDLPTISAPESVVLNCSNQSIQIDATGSSNGSDFILEWQDANGNTITDFTTLNPTVSEAGEYQLTITNLQNNCDASTIVNVVEDFVQPIAQVTSVEDINCIDLTSTFGLELSNPDWAFSWADDNGPIDGEDQFQLTTSEPGNYSLSIVDQNNGCENAYPFTLISTISQPQIDFMDLPELSCLQTEIEISASTDAEDPSFLWSTMDGNILSTDDLASIEINASGTYAVTVVDGVTGCEAIQEVVIAENANLPDIEIADPDQITCVVDEVSLIATASNIGSDVEYIWTTDDGVLASPNGASNISVSSDGNYTLTVVNNDNGCSSSISTFVEESVSTFLVDIEQPNELNCDITQFDLMATENSGSQVLYAWSTNNGNIIAGEETLNPTINQAGDYILVVTDPSNGCTSESSITVVQDSNVPELSIDTPSMITCDMGQVEINALGSSEGLDFLIEWTTINGNIISGENSLTPNVSSAGTYTLSITNTTNNCQLTQDVDIVADNLSPELDLLPIDTIDCDNPSVFITANLTNSVSNLSYIWTSTDGSFSLTTTDSNIELSAAGNYSLQAINTDNGCFTIIPFLVMGNENVPDVSIVNPNNIDCENNSSVVTIDVGPNAQNYTYQWSTSNGMIDGATDGDAIIATSPGLYDVTVTDTQSNCDIILSTQVDTDANIPALDFIEPNIITCAEPRAVINTQTLINGLIYEWSTTNGEITSALNGEDVVVSTAGIYALTVTNPANNCQNNITVEVFEDIELPTVEIEEADELNCITTEQDLLADGSSTGPEFTYQWTTALGQIVAGENTLTPTINAPGFYTLEIINIENECKQVDSIFISENTVQPLASLDIPQDIDCINEVVDISSDITNTENLDILWTTSDGNILSDPTATSIEVDMAGSYDLQIIDQTNGCENLLSTLVNQNSTLPVLEVSEGFTLNCDLTEGTLSITQTDPTAEVSWLDPQMNVLSTDMDISLSEPGIYTAVALFTATGCETIKTVEILKNENVPTEIVSDISPPLCFGDVGSISILEVIGGEGPYLYSTDGGQSFGDLNILEDLAPGSVSEIIAQDANGCLLPSVILMPDLIDTEANLPSLVELKLGENYQMQVQTNIPTADIESIVWTPSTGLSCTECLNPTVNPDNSINYEVQITTINGCVEIADIQFRVDRNVQVYIPNAFSPFNEDGVNDRFFVFANDNVVANIQSLQVYDRWGNQLFINENFSPNEASAGWGGMFREQQMQAGVYIYYAIVEYFDGTTELFKGDLTLLE